MATEISELSRRLKAMARTANSFGDKTENSDMKELWYLAELCSTHFGNNVDQSEEIVKTLKKLEAL